MRLPLALSCLALLSACSTHPITGRDQITALSPVQLAYADTEFALASSAQRIAASMACVEGCGDPAMREVDAARVKAIGAQLETAALSLAPELFERIASLSIEVDAAPGFWTGSSAGGRVLVSAGLAGLRSAEPDPAIVGRSELEPGLGGRSPTDIRLAFLIARELGHVIARHAEENSGASIAVSFLGLLLPGASVVARFIASRVGAGVVRDSWALEQEREADEIALDLLARTGVFPMAVSHALQGGAARLLVPEDAWGSNYLQSIQRVARIAATPLRYSGADE
jgi:hypothetical protein